MSRSESDLSAGSIEQQENERLVERLDREMERRLAARIARVDGGVALVDERVGGVELPVERRQMQRAVAVVFRLVHKPLSAARTRLREQRTQRAHVAAESRQMQRVEAAAVGGRQVGAAREQQAHEVLPLPGDRVVQRRVAAQHM